MAYDLKRTSRLGFGSGDSSGAEVGRVGEELASARLALGLTVEEMATRLRIRRPYLEALEEGRLRDLPGPAYATGFVRAYATALGLDADEMVRRFRDLSGVAANQKTPLIFPEPVPERGVPAGAVVVVGAVLAIGSYVAWYNISGAGDRTVDRVPPVPARLEQAADQGRTQMPGREAARAAGPGALPLSALPPPGGLPPVVPSAPPAPPSSGANTSALAATMPAAPPPVVEVVPVEPPPALVEIPGLPDGTRVVLRARMDSPDGAWVQVKDQRSGQTLVSRVLRPGEAWPVPVRDGVLLLDTGKAQGLDIVVDGALSDVLEGQVGVRRNIALAPERLRQRSLAPSAAIAPGR
ncbi:helix-turn-helix domain-containing protein [Falsiroseomonas sp. E2-1-a20]|uniref:helix-turn-helix domain-containing protein n=1 Tax=Falsiroseomonas sp. E2-1-a20 TaxID=3239300 RepID=UPI003F3242DA